MRRLYILRPEPGASETVEQARALGIDALAMPLFEVEPLEWEAPDSGNFDALLLTSANAVRHGGEQLHGLRGVPVHAVGEATAEAAREAGFDIASTGDTGVERLLASIKTDLRLLHLCGEHRTAVEAKRHITQIPVYRSAELPVPRNFPAVADQAIAIHSPRAGRRLGELVNEARIARSTVRIAAISQTAASAAGDGWQTCEAAERPDSMSLLALAARLCDKPDPE